MTSLTCPLSLLPWMAIKPAYLLEGTLFALYAGIVVGSLTWGNLST
jgi:hypothetical protein